MSIAITSGCAKRSTEASSPAMDTASGDDLAVLEQQLTQREAQLQAAGYSPRAKRAAPRDGADMNSEAESAPSEPTAPERANEPAPMAGTASTAPTTQQREDEGALGGRCQRVCEITTAICSLEGQICGLVPRHPDDERYQAACDRAADDCRYATEVCHACT